MIRKTVFFAWSLCCVSHFALGHGFDVSVNSTSDPTSFNITSAQPILDQNGVTPGPQNLFLDEFDSNPNSDGSYSTYEGFAQTSGPFPPFTATFNVISPLYFSDGTGAAALATAGTNLHIYDRYAGNSDGSHPGASAGDLYVNGATSFYAGFGVSLADFHELEKDLYLAAGSTQTYGEYGFAFDITVSFTSGQILNTGPLVDVFAISDPNLGDFSDNAPNSVQDAATTAIFSAAVTAVPEPSTWTMLASAGFALAGITCRKRHSRGGRRVAASRIRRAPKEPAASDGDVKAR